MIPEEMTLKEIEQWVDKYSANLIDCVHDMDSCTNEYEQRIYKIGDKLYALDFCNGFFSRVGKGKNGESVYKPYEVKSMQRIIYDYLPVED